MSDLKVWDNRFMDIASTIAEWSSCFKNDRHVGAVIVKDNRILATGYNGAPSGVITCRDKGECIRVKNDIPSGTRQEMCYAVHAEQNAIIQAAKLGVSVDGATLYCTHQPCVLCAKMIINAGIKRVVFKHGYPDDFAKMIFEAGDVFVERMRIDPPQDFYVTKVMEDDWRFRNEQQENDCV